MLRNLAFQRSPSAEGLSVTLTGAGAPGSLILLSTTEWMTSVTCERFYLPGWWTPLWQNSSHQSWQEQKSSCFQQLFSSFQQVNIFILENQPWKEVRITSSLSGFIFRMNVFQLHTDVGSSVWREREDMESTFIFSLSDTGSDPRSVGKASERTSLDHNGATVSRRGAIV